ncbi:MAG: hypothetical protein WAP35_07900 [Solirubrobacterales bacterium]
MFAGLSKRLRDERGFSLLELQVAELIGGFVITAAISMMIIAVNSSSRVTDRVNAAATGRVGMEQIQQQLRSQTCLFPGEYRINGSAAAAGPAPAIIHADDTRLVYFGDLGATGAGASSNGSVGFAPQMRWLYVGANGTAGTMDARKVSILEGARPATNNTAPFNFTISPAGTLASLAPQSTMDTLPPVTRRLVIDGVTNTVGESAPVGATGPTVGFFRYYDANDVEILPSAAISAIPAPELATISRITVGFKVLGSGWKDETRVGTSAVDKRTAVFRNDIYLRTVADRCQ